MRPSTVPQPTPAPWPQRSEGPAGGRGCVCVGGGFLQGTLCFVSGVWSCALLWGAARLLRWSWPQLPLRASYTRGMKQRFVLPSMPGC